LNCQELFPTQWDMYYQPHRRRPSDRRRYDIQSESNSSNTTM